MIHETTGKDTTITHKWQKAFKQQISKTNEI